MKAFSSWIGSWICCFRFAFFPHRGNLEDPYQSFFYFVNCQNGFDPKLYNFSLKALSFESYTRFDFMSTQFIHTIFKITPPKIAKFTWLWVIPYDSYVMTIQRDNSKSRTWPKLWTKFLKLSLQKNDDEIIIFRLHRSHSVVLQSPWPWM